MEKIGNASERNGSERNTMGSQPLTPQTLNPVVVEQTEMRLHSLRVRLLELAAEAKVLAQDTGKSHTLKRVAEAEQLAKDDVQILSDWFAELALLNESFSNRGNHNAASATLRERARYLLELADEKDGITRPFIERRKQA